MNNEPNAEPITEITEAPMETKGALIDTNDTEIQPISYSIEDQPKEKSTVELEQDLLEKPAPIKKQRTEKQIQAFRKAQEALKAKRLLRKQEKDKLPKPKRGRPIKVKKKEEVEEEDTDEEDIDEEVYITTRRKGSSKRSQKKTTKPKPKRRIVYVSESESSSESEEEEETEEETEEEEYGYTPVDVSPYAGLRFL